MGFNYAREKEKFDREWTKLRKEYTQAGMDGAAIQKMYDFDWAAFLAQRTYANRTQRLPDELHSGTDETERSKLLRKYKSLTVSFEDELIAQGKNWTDFIEDPRLVRGLKRLSQDELELLMQLVLLEYSQRELARYLGCSQHAVYSWYKKIKERFK